MSVPTPGQPTTPLLRGVSFEADGSVVLEFCQPTQDAKANGVLMNHTLFIPGGSDYDDEIEAVVQAALALLADVQEDLPFLEPARITADDQDEEQDDDEDEDDDERDGDGS